MKYSIIALLVLFIIISSCVSTPIDEDNYILIEKGNFIPGSLDSSDNLEDYEYVKSFYMKSMEVTVEEYITFLNDIIDERINTEYLIDINDSDCVIAKNDSIYFFDSSTYIESEDCPIVEVTWLGAIYYCNWLSRSNNLNLVYTINGTDVKANFYRSGYRLPSEAEWEYAACSGGQEDQVYSGTGDEDEFDTYSWYYQNSSSRIHPVGIKDPNELGIYDMSGNVWEWCWDKYIPDPIIDTVFTNITERKRAIRGGSWGDHASSCTVFSRKWKNKDDSSINVGFRPVRNAN